MMLIMLLTAGLLAFFSLEQGHDWGGDFALYLRQAQSLLDGTSEELLAFNSYAMNNSTQGTGANPQIGPHLYPWGFPLLLAPLVAVTGFAIMPAKILIIGFFLLTLLTAYHLMLPRLGHGYSLLLVALLAFNPHLVQVNNVIISDVPFFFFALLSLIFIEKTLGYRSFFINKWVTYILTGFLIFFSFLTRTNGIVLLGVLGLGHLFKWYLPLRQHFGQTFKKEWKELLPYISFSVFFILKGLLLPSGSGSHLAFLARLTPGKLAWNLMYYTELPASFFEGALFPMLLYGITIPFLLLGIWRRLTVMPDALYIIYCAASLLIFVLWPPVQGLRFIFSLLPFYLYFVFIGLMEAQKSFLTPSAPGRKFVRPALVPLFCLLVGGMFLISTTTMALSNYPERRMAEGPYNSPSAEAFAFIKENTQPGEEVLFWKPRTFAFMADRQALRITNIAEVMEGKGDYLLYYKLVDFGQLPKEELEQLSKMVKPSFENEEYILFRLHDLPGRIAQKNDTLSNQQEVLSTN